MFLKNAVINAICGSTLVLLPAIGQESLSEPHIGIETSVPFVENTRADGAQQSASANYSPLNGYPMIFDRPNGAESTYDYTQPSNLQLDGRSIGAKYHSDGVFGANGIQPFAKRWSPVAQVGALTLDPRTAAGVRPQTDWGYLYSDSSHFSLKNRSFPRTEHRGAFDNSETFRMDGLNIPERFINRERPTVVFGLNF